MSRRSASALPLMPGNTANIGRPYVVSKNQWDALNARLANLEQSSESDARSLNNELTTRIATLKQSSESDARLLKNELTTRITELEQSSESDARSLKNELATRITELEQSSERDARLLKVEFTAVHSEIFNRLNNIQAKQTTLDHSMFLMKQGLPDGLLTFEAAAKVKHGKTANSAETFQALRTMLRQYGVEKFKSELPHGLIEDGQLTTGTKPFNLFARLAAGEMKQPEMAESNLLLGKAGTRWLVACNREENDANYESDDARWVGKASMSARHRFLTVRDLDWKWFNVLTIGIDGSADELHAAVERLEDMVATAKAFTHKAGWSNRLGLYFHCFPHNSVPSLHMHMVDLDATGPTYDALQYKNLPAEDVLTVLRAEAHKADAAAITGGRAV